MSDQDNRKKVLAKRLGVSERVLEQYLELKQAEVNEDTTSDWMLSRRGQVSGASLSSGALDGSREERRKQKDSKRRFGRVERRVSEGSS